MIYLNQSESDVIAALCNAEIDRPCTDTKPGHFRRVLALLPCISHADCNLVLELLFGTTGEHDLICKLGGGLALLAQLNQQAKALEAEEGDKHRLWAIEGDDTKRLQMARGLIPIANRLEACFQEMKRLHLLTGITEQQSRDYERELAAQPDTAREGGQK